MKSKFKIRVETIEDSIALGSALYHDVDSTYFYIRFLHWGLIIGKLDELEDEEWEFK